MCVESIRCDRRHLPLNLRSIGKVFTERISRSPTILDIHVNVDARIRIVPVFFIHQHLFQCNDLANARSQQHHLIPADARSLKRGLSSHTNNQIARIQGVILGRTYTTSWRTARQSNCAATESRMRSLALGFFTSYKSSQHQSLNPTFQEQNITIQASNYRSGNTE